jgi:hypothetical protein
MGIAPLGWVKALAPHHEPAGVARTDTTHDRPPSGPTSGFQLPPTSLPEPYRQGAIGNVLNKVA